MKKLIIIGDSAFAEIAYEYFTHDSEYEVVGFAVSKAFLKVDSFCGLPVVCFEDIEKHFPPLDHSAFVALTYGDMNRNRQFMYEQTKSKGYELASYISTRAFVWQNVQMGDNCFIFEDNTIQPFVTIGHNTILWSGNHIGHHSNIGSHVFISSHVVISGFDNVGDNCFIGVNSTLVNNIDLGSDTWVGPSCTVTRNTESGSFFKPCSSTPSDVTSYRFFRIEQDRKVC
ncbi:MAG: acetyltransferase [Alphaproteobacteria bacterium]|nr:acetyltransferase [Alphaproteobacteria bacterium]